MTKTITLPAYGWTPRPDQMPAWKALMSPDINLVALAAHRRYGKDALGLSWIATEAMQKVGSYLYTLPEYSQARKTIWDGVNARTGRTRIDDAFPPEIIKRRDDKGMFIQLINNSTVQLAGSDSVDGLVGAGIRGLVMSEAGLCDPRAWALFRPMLLETKGKSLHIGTPRGKNGFYNIIEANRNKASAHVQIISAYDTPVFSAEQLKEERHTYIQEHGTTMGNALFSQEYEASFEAAIVGAVWGAEITKLKQSGRLAPCGYDPRYPVHTAWDLGVRDFTIILYFQSVGNEERLIDITAATDLGLDSYAKILAEKGYYYGNHWGPHDIQNREWGTGTSRMDQAARLGLHFKRVSNTPKDDQIALGAQLMNRLVINNTEDLDSGEPVCGYALEALTNYRFKFDVTRKISSSTPVHDWTSHVADAFMTYACAKARDIGFQRPQNILQQHSDTPMPRLSAIMARMNKPTGSMWG